MSHCVMCEEQQQQQQGQQGTTPCSSPRKGGGSTQRTQIGIILFFIAITCCIALLIRGVYVTELTILSHEQQQQHLMDTRQKGRKYPLAPYDTRDYVTDDEPSTHSDGQAFHWPVINIHEEIRREREQLRFHAVHNKQLGEEDVRHTAVALQVPEEGHEGGEGRRAPPRAIVKLAADDYMPAMIAPHDGLVFCPIAKVVVGEWKKAFRWMLGIWDWEHGPIYDPKKNKIPLLSEMGVDEANHIINDHKWVKAVIVRDPAERLLSQFLDKCIENYRHEYDNCPYIYMMADLFPDDMKPLPEYWPTNKQTHFYTNLIKNSPELVFHSWVNAVAKDVTQYNCNVNAHWRPQYCFCALEKSIHLYHVFNANNLTFAAEKIAESLVIPKPERKEKLTRFLTERFAAAASSSLSSSSSSVNSQQGQKDLRRYNNNTKKHEQERRRTQDAMPRFLTANNTDIVTEAYAKDYALLREYL